MNIKKITVFIYTCVCTYFLLKAADIYHIDLQLLFTFFCPIPFSAYFIILKVEFVSLGHDHQIIASTLTSMPTLKCLPRLDNKFAFNYSLHLTLREVITVQHCNISPWATLLPWGTVMLMLTFGNFRASILGNKYDLLS